MKRVACLNQFLALGWNPEYTTMDGNSFARSSPMQKLSIIRVPDFTEERIIGRESCVGVLSPF